MSLSQVRRAVGCMQYDQLETWIEGCIRLRLLNDDGVHEHTRGEPVGPVLMDTAKNGSGWTISEVLIAVTSSRWGTAETSLALLSGVGRGNWDRAEGPWRGRI